MRRRRKIAGAGAALVAALAGAGAYVLVIGEPGDGPGTTDPTVTTDTTGSTTTTTTGPGARRLDREQVASAESIVSQFIDEIGRGDLSAAARRWTGYGAAVALDGPPTDRAAVLEELVVDPTFAQILESDTEMFVTPSWAFVGSPVGPVVTLLAAGGNDHPPAAVAFLVDTSPWEDTAELHIQRIPLDVAPVSEPAPPSGSTVAAGQEIVVPVFPVEGGVHVHVNGVEVPYHLDFGDPPSGSDGLPLTFTIPESASGDVAVTLTAATPEFPQVRAFAYTVRER